MRRLWPQSGYGDMKPEIVNLKDCERFLTKDGSFIREILAPRNSSLKRQSLAEATVPVGGATNEHYHVDTEEVYFILAGHGEFELEGETAPVTAGDGIVIPPQAKHRIRNLGNSDLVFLCICVPAYEHHNTVLTDS
jgi:mannose-6-phosphate isomerase-like protein (cupin superfamily)